MIILRQKEYARAIPNEKVISNLLQRGNESPLLRRVVEKPVRKKSGYPLLNKYGNQVYETASYDRKAINHALSLI